MKQITSRDNALYKELKQLATSASARKKTARSLLDGVHLCQAYLQHRGAPLMCVVADSSVAHPEVATILARCTELSARCIALPDALYQAISQVEHGVGIVFIIDLPQTQTSTSLKKNAVLLDGLQDPGNLGSILRSAAGAGIQQVYCSAGTVSAWSPKVLRAGMGAHFLLDIFEAVDLHALLSQAEVPVLATSSHTEKTIYHINLNRPVAWLFGHEGQGVDPSLMAMASEMVTIPQNAAIESLNVAASAAICFFEQVRQRLA